MSKQRTETDTGTADHAGRRPTRPSPAAARAAGWSTWTRVSWRRTRRTSGSTWAT